MALDDPSGSLPDYRGDRRAASRTVLGQFMLATTCVGLPLLAVCAFALPGDYRDALLVSVAWMIVTTIVALFWWRQAGNARALADDLDARDRQIVDQSDRISKIQAENATLREAHAATDGKFVTHSHTSDTVRAERERVAGLVRDLEEIQRVVDRLAGEQPDDVVVGYLKKIVDERLEGGRVM